MGENLNHQIFRSQLEKLSELDYNYDEKVFHEAKDKSGWNLDRYFTVLATEPPGPPIADGPFEAIRQSIQLYQFPDPRLITAVFDPESSLPGRNMLLLAKFAGFTFEFGVRVTSVVDEIRKNKLEQPVQHWGYSYRTLKGHFEIGEIRFEVTKNMETGEVGFEIDAYSKPDRIPHFFYRMGFKLFGRPLQKYFASSSLRRLQSIAKNRLRPRADHHSKVKPQNSND